MDGDLQWEFATGTAGVGCSIHAPGHHQGASSRNLLIAAGEIARSRASRLLLSPNRALRARRGAPRPREWAGYLAKSKENTHE